ncbi:SAV0927 family protein [Brockia lithotrophica]|uniref:Uncharacterized protein n=1 Tax=Brockia lithotrophica TaxID=933949 RepID=A0A660KXE4_9BACL|nr:SAV0927 family protein [Brockia lithotrophica]RKQ84696.1 hypothetical protein C7438_1185 [Brockia lithotrophica]
MDVLYDREEKSRLRAFGAIAEDGTRADFVVVQSEFFMGKAVVVNLLTGRAALLDRDDLREDEEWAIPLGISPSEAPTWRDALERLLPEA